MISPTFVIMILRVTASHHYSERRAFIMPKKVSVKPILELRAAGISMRKIESLMHVSRHTISAIYKAADVHSISWDNVKDFDEDKIYEMLFPPVPKTSVFEEVDYDYIHSELKKTGVNLKLLWNEYRNQCISKGTIPCGYTKFCKGYSNYVQLSNVTNHLTHKPGSTIEVDWSGPTMSILTPDGERIKVYLFVATLPYSQYSFVKPCLDMKQETWLKCHIDMFEFFGGIPIKIVCDNLKTGVIKHPKEGEIVLNEAYESLAQHYMVAIMPAQVRKPKQKPSVEGTVGKIASAIIAKLRNIRFISLSHVEEEIFKALKEFNDAPFQKREGSRTEVFMNCEKEMLRELPAIPYEVCTWLYDHKVSLDFHVSFKTNKYSVPYQYVGKKVDIKVNSNSLEIFYEHSRIAIHPKLPDYMKYKYSTIEDHMPDAFQKVEWDDERIKRWANKIGPSTFVVINKIFDSVKIKEQGYNSCLTVLKLANKFSNDRLENACELALTKVKCPRYHHLNGILMNNQDLIWMSNKDSNKKIDDGGYVRGADYYGGKYND